MPGNAFHIAGMEDLPMYPNNSHKGFHIGQIEYKSCIVDKIVNIRTHFTRVIDNYECLNTQTQI